MRSYRVFITDNGSFKALRTGVVLCDVDVTNSFECGHWSVFQLELQRRLLKEKVAHTTSGESDEKI